MPSGLKKGIRPLMNSVRVVLRNGASFQLATTMRRSGPVFLQHVRAGGGAARQAAPAGAGCWGACCVAARCRGALRSRRRRRRRRRRRQRLDPFRARTACALPTLSQQPPQDATTSPACSCAPHLPLGLPAPSVLPPQDTTTNPMWR